MSLRSALLFALAMTPGIVAAQTQITESVNWALPGCRSFLVSSDFQAFKQGYCGGMVVSLMTVGADLPAGFRFCVPGGTSTEQAMRVLVIYLERRPILQHEPFYFLAREAFHEAWPCR
jgi:hypothetical protein